MTLIILSAKVMIILLKTKYFHVFLLLHALNSRFISQSESLPTGSHSFLLSKDRYNNVSFVMALHIFKCS